MRHSAQTVQFHELFEAIAANSEGAKIRGRRYRQRDHLSGDAYQYAYRKSDFDSRESDDQTSKCLEDLKKKLATILSEQEIRFLCSVYPVGSISLRQLAAQTNLSAATWSRHMKAVYEDLRAILSEDE